MIHPLALLGYLWLAAIIGCAALLLFHGAQALLRVRPLPTSRVAWSAIGLVALTLPLWIESVLLEFQCRSAGLTLAASTQATTEGLYWRSHFVAENSYSSGIPLGTDPLRQAFALGALRALSEGRIAYLEIPYEPIVDPQATLNQKLFVALREDQSSECVGEPVSSAWGHLPKSLCIAWETTPRLNTRFEVVGLQGEGYSGTTVGIKDRQSEEEIARYTHVPRTRASETLLALWGIRSIQPRSCTPKMTDIGPGAALVSLAFKPRDGVPVTPGTVEPYLSSAWAVVRPPPPDLAIPTGRAGIEYWIARGAVRQLTADDLSLWRAASSPSSPSSISFVPNNAFVIEGNIKLPSGLYGANAVTWIVASGTDIPPGPRGHSTYLAEGKGCLWSPSKCR